MKLDLTKPVQVDPDLSNEWVDCSFAKKLNGHPEDRYAVIYSRCGGRERIGLYEARFLRNTPAPAPVEEGWRYFQTSLSNRWRTNGVTNEILQRGVWVADPLDRPVWSVNGFITAGFYETDAHGDPLATTPKPCDYSSIYGGEHGPATQTKGGFNICQKCYDAIIAAEKKEEAAYAKDKTPPPTRRVPYTAETWPAWAVWVRRKNWGEGERQAVGAVRKENISVFGFDASYANLAENYEISGTDGIWHAASREVEA